MLTRFLTGPLGRLKYCLTTKANASGVVSSFSKSIYGKSTLISTLSAKSIMLLEKMFIIDSIFF
jgi:hypothetical protein